MKSRQYANVRFAGFRGGRRRWNAIIHSGAGKIHFSSLSSVTQIAIGRFMRLQLGLKPLEPWEEDVIRGISQLSARKNSSP